MCQHTAVGYYTVCIVPADVALYDVMPSYSAMCAVAAQRRGRSVVEAFVTLRRVVCFNVVWRFVLVGIVIASMNKRGPTAHDKYE